MTTRERLTHLASRACGLAAVVSFFLPWEERGAFRGPIRYSGGALLLEAVEFLARRPGVFLDDAPDPLRAAWFGFSHRTIAAGTAGSLLAAVALVLLPRSRARSSAAVVGVGAAASYALLWRLVALDLFGRGWDTVWLAVAVTGVLAPLGLAAFVVAKVTLETRRRRPAALLAVAALLLAFIPDPYACYGARGTLLALLLAMTIDLTAAGAASPGPERTRTPGSRDPPLPP